MDSRKRKQDKVPSQHDNKMEIVVGDEDKMSELPEPLLLHILSLVPTKCAVSTSILSKRWRYVWTSLPILDFRQWWSHKVKKDLQIRCFTRFMDRMLAPRGDYMPNIQEFYLDFDENLSISRVNEWVSTLVQRKVEKLHLDIGFMVRSFTLAPCLFTCESLTTLELHSGYYLMLPESISFPRLKILRLTRMDFVGEKRTQLFFSNSCPVLEELIMNDCGWGDMKYVIISAPALKNLAFRCTGFRRTRVLDNCVVKINEPNLLSLVYMECVATDYVMCSFSSLVDANIDLRRPAKYGVSVAENQSIGYAANKLVQKLSNVKALKMSSDTFMILSLAGDLLITERPTFHNLIHLEVTSSSPYSIIGSFFHFLHVTPNLESLVFAEDPYRDYRDDGWTLSVVPQCLLLHLKTVKFRAHRGFSRSNELTWVKLFLKSAAVLQNMTIITTSPCSSEIMEEILIMFPRASTNCVVNVLST